MSLFSYLRRRLENHRIAFRRRANRPVLTMEMLEGRDVPASSIWNINGGVYDLSQTQSLHSNSSAKQVIFLDFDGHTTGDVYGSDWDNIASPAWDYSGNGPSFTDTEKRLMQRIWARVAEDFAPFNVDVTTQDPGVEALRKTGATDMDYGIRIVITPDDTPAPGAGGVAYIGSFKFNTDTPAYVFNFYEKDIAEVVSHEVGHSLGLGHDGTATAEYYSGHGSGATSWGPIMGASYSPNVSQWSKGQYAGADNTEDDLSKITTLNGFSYRTDDFGNTQATATSLLAKGANRVGAVEGMIERNSDSDWFSFWSGTGTTSLRVDPVALGANLAVRVDLYNSSGVLLTTVNPPNVLNAVLSYSISTPGEYFLKVTGTGKGDPRTNGFSNYGSLGNYRITGTVPAFSVTAPQLVSMTVNGNIAALAGNQRSRVASVVLVFEQAVQLDANAVTLGLYTNNVAYNGVLQPSGFGALPTSLILTTSDNITWVVTFAGNTDDGSDGYNSLKDGVYELVIDAAKVHPSNAPSVNMAAQVATTFHRLFSDSNGAETTNGGKPGADFRATVNTGDNLAFRGVFNNPQSYVAALDLNGDGIINSGENLRFRNRFNKALTWSV
jgi:hypothetical protein